ncbi:MAG: sugar-binding domain-containing protein [Planctomycetia bacterium]|nr:sugar-binding domain-containing protein [Planctomycetia bacterium]
MFARLSAPASLADAETCEQFLRLEQSQHVMTRIARADLALIRAGTPENPVFVGREVHGPKDLAAVRHPGAGRGLLGRFHNHRGDERPTPLRDREVSPGLGGMRGIARRVEVVAGARLQGLQ